MPSLTGMGLVFVHANGQIQARLGVAAQVEIESTI
jgi:hypothetical protein